MGSKQERNTRRSIASFRFHLEAAGAMPVPVGWDSCERPPIVGCGATEAASLSISPKESPFPLAFPFRPISYNIIDSRENRGGSINVAGGATSAGRCVFRGSRLAGYHFSVACLNRAGRGGPVVGVIAARKRGEWVRSHPGTLWRESRYWWSMMS